MVWLRILALLLAGCCAAHAAEPLQNFVVPTPAAGDNSNRAASTAFVQGAITSGLPLPSGQIYIGSLANLAAAQTLSGAGDCTISLAINGVLTFTCTKTNGTAFSVLATTVPGTGVATALGTSVGSAGAMVINGGALGTPSSGSAANLTNLPAANLTGTVPAATLPSAPLINSISSNVLLNNTSTYFDGPSVAQGTTGKWFASGQVNVNSSTADVVVCKLWDGTTVVAAAVSNMAVGANIMLPLSGVFSTPAGNIKISCRDTSSTNGVIASTTDSMVKASTVSAFRIN